VLGWAESDRRYSLGAFRRVLTRSMGGFYLTYTVNTVHFLCWIDIDVYRFECVPSTEKCLLVLAVPESNPDG
jgi:hypothetical protein